MDSDDYLMLSGIQHFAFCKRQWALIHLEQFWKENHFTFQGRQMHKNVDNPCFTESRGDVLISRAVPLVSHDLKITGIADVVEFHRSESGISIPGKQGFWSVLPVEYKVGKKKAGDWDNVQLCAQALCLEEMCRCSISRGSIYYGKTRRRVDVVFDDELRNLVRELVSQMYELYDSESTPRAVYEKHCESCSLIDFCLPHASERNVSVGSYVNSVFGGHHA